MPAAGRLHRELFPRIQEGDVGDGPCAGRHRRLDHDSRRFDPRPGGHLMAEALPAELSNELSRPIILADLFAMIEDPTLAWEPMRPGIEIYRLYRWPTGQSAALLRYAPEASLAPHRHVAFEHIF